MRICYRHLLILTALSCPLGKDLFGEDSVDATLKDLKKSLVSEKKFHAEEWIALSDLEKKISTPGNEVAYSELSQIKSLMLIQAGLPHAAFKSIDDALSRLPSTFAKERQSLLRSMLRLSNRYTQWSFVERLGTSQKELLDYPESQYYLGLNLMQKKRPKEAKAAFARLVEKDPKWKEARFHLALLNYESGDKEEASLILRAMLKGKVEAEDSEFYDRVHLTLGRIYFETKELAKASLEYRQVLRTSRLFPDALREQAWILFSAAKPLYALGSLHSYYSPFFGETFDPEARLLQALSFFWICRYSDASHVVNNFYAEEFEDLKILRSYIAQHKKGQAQENYPLIASFLSGSKLEDQGLNRRLMSALIRDESIRRISDELADLSREKQILLEQGVLGSQVGTQPLTKLYEEKIQTRRNDLGEIFDERLGKVLKASEDSLNQFALLKIELLMSQKEQIVGKELHEADKYTGGIDKSTDSIWAQTPQSWSGLRGQEYWWDEVGFYISSVPSECHKGGQE